MPNESSYLQKLEEVLDSYRRTARVIEQQERNARADRKSLDSKVEAAIKNKNLELALEVISGYEAKYLQKPQQETQSGQEKPQAEFKYDLTYVKQQAGLTTRNIGSYARHLKRGEDYVVEDGKRLFSESGLAKLLGKPKSKKQASESDLPSRVRDYIRVHKQVKRFLTTVVAADLNTSPVAAYNIMKTVPYLKEKTIGGRPVFDRTRPKKSKKKR